MSEYIFDDIRIITSAEIVNVYRNGEKLIRKKKVRIFSRLKYYCKQFWNNDYFKRHTKTYFGIKIAEFGSRFIGANAIYQLLKDRFEPYLPEIIDAIQYLIYSDTIKLIKFFDFGFAFGILFTIMIVQLKRKFRRLLKND